MAVQSDHLNNDVYGKDIVLWMGSQR